MADSASIPANGAAAARPRLPFIIGSSAVGTLIEWYDFYIYGVLAVFFSQHFFPPGNDALALLASLGIFWTGFVVRPLGSVIFGHFGDRIGRKFTFMLTLLLMGAATFLVGVLPDYEAIGILAPIALVVLRIVQGLALGGEYGGAATYVAEHAPDGKRGLYTSWIQTTATLGIVLALGVILICRAVLGDEAFTDWGWRIPFLISAVLVIVSVWIRMRLEESPVFTELKAQGKRSENPVGESFGNKGNRKTILLALFGATAPEGVVWYTSQFYVLFYLTTVLNIDYSTVYAVMMVALVLAAPFFIVFGALSDRIGRRNIMVAGFALAIISYWPVFTWFSHFQDNPVMLVVLVFYLALLVTMVYGPIAAFLVEIFPARIRYTSMSLPYHVGNGVFGGGVPFIGGVITTATGVALSGLIYPVAVAGIGIVVALAGLPADTHKNSIWKEVEEK